MYQSVVMEVPFIPHTATFPHHPGNLIRTMLMPRNPVLSSLLIGPLVGAVAAWLVLTIYSLVWPAYPNSVQVLGWISLLLIAIPVGYIIGFVPSLIAGMFNAALADSKLGITGRIVLAFPIGILTTWLCWFWLIFGMPSYNVGIYAAMFTAAGALGCPAAVWWASRPRRAKPSAEVPA